MPDSTELRDKVIPIDETPLTEDYATPHSNFTYPYVQILDASEALALIVPGLPPGPLQLIMTYKGKTRQVGTCSKSAIALERLTRISKIEFVRSPNECILCKCGKDVLELGVI